MENSNNWIIKRTEIPNSYFVIYEMKDFTFKFKISFYNVRLLSYFIKRVKLFIFKQAVSTWIVFYDLEFPGFKFCSVFWNQIGMILTFLPFPDVWEILVDPEKVNSMEG